MKYLAPEDVVPHPAMTAFALAYPLKTRRARFSAVLPLTTAGLVVGAHVHEQKGVVIFVGIWVAAGLIVVVVADGKGTGITFLTGLLKTSKATSLSCK